MLSLLRYRRVIIGLPRKNGKSFIASIIQIANLFNSFQGDELYAAAKDRKQAKIVWEGVEKFIYQVPGWKNHIKITASEHVMKNLHTGVKFSALGSDGGAAQGFAPYVSIADELHEWDSQPGRKLWSALADGSGDREEALVVGISTAGQVYDSLLGNLFQQGRSLSDLEIDDINPNPSYGFFWWGADGNDDISDPEVWAKANPMVAEGLYSMEELESAWASVEQNGLNDFMRYHLNMFSGAQGNEGEMTWIDSPHHLERLLADPVYGKLEEGDRIVVGFDGSRLHDSTALVGICIDPDEDGRHRVELLGIWEKVYSNPAWKVPREEVMDKVDEIFAKFSVESFFADDSEWREELRTWSEAYGRVVNKVPQNQRRMKEAQIAGLNYILDGYLKFPDDSNTSRLHSHISNAVIKYTGTITKPAKRSRAKIDAAIAFILAISALTRFNARSKNTTGAYRFIAGYN